MTSDLGRVRDGPSEQATRTASNSERPIVGPVSNSSPRVFVFVVLVEISTSEPVGPARRDGPLRVVPLTLLPIRRWRRVGDVRRNGAFVEPSTT